MKFILHFLAAYGIAVGFLGVWGSLWASIFNSRDTAIIMSIPSIMLFVCSLVMAIFLAPLGEE